MRLFDIICYFLFAGVLLLLFVWVLRCFQQFFSHITKVSGCDRELNAHFYSAASLKYHAQDTWHDTTLSHIILTLGRSVLALPRKSECQARSSQYHFKRLWYVTARDQTQDLPFHGVDTLPTELSGQVCRCVHCIVLCIIFWNLINRKLLLFGIIWFSRFLTI